MPCSPTRHPLLVIALLWLAGLSGSSAGDFDDGTIMHIAYPDWFNASFLDLQEDLALARADGKHGLMVLFTTEGCSYCAEFIRRSLGDERLAAKTRSHFSAVGLEIFSDAEMTDPTGTPLRVKEFASLSGAGFAPTLLFYGNDGELLYRGVGYHTPERFELVLDYLIDADLIGGDAQQPSFRDYAAGRSATTARESTYRLAPDALFSPPPYALDRSRVTAEQPLLVIFEADGCSNCAEFHDGVLASSEVREIHAGFEVVRLDANDKDTPVLAPDGSRTTPADWYADAALSHLPALLFFDEDGNEVLRTDALVMRQRMTNALGYTLERAYRKGWSYQRFARSKAQERMRQ